MNEISTYENVIDSVGHLLEPGEHCATWTNPGGRAIAADYPKPYPRSQRQHPRKQALRQLKNQGLGWNSWIVERRGGEYIVHRADAGSWLQPVYRRQILRSFGSPKPIKLARPSALAAA